MQCYFHSLIYQVDSILLLLNPSKNHINSNITLTYLYYIMLTLAMNQIELTFSAFIINLSIWDR